MFTTIRRIFISTQFFAAGFCIIILAQSGFGADSDTQRVIARGGGVTMIEGGTGSPGFIPVLTKIGFHAEANGDVVSGGFECLALAPSTGSGLGSGEFNVNAMYVTGRVKTATVEGRTATLTGTATITGLGAGTNVPFTFVVNAGGPGATAVLTTESSPRLVFNEILLEGSFRVFGRPKDKRPSPEFEALSEQVGEVKALLDRVAERNGLKP